jgi:hypothetical protein
VTAIDDEEGVVTVEIAPGTEIKMLRQGISQRFVEEENADDELVDDVTDEADRAP